MIQHVKKIMIRILMITLLLIMLGLIIWYALGESTISLQDTLFWIGAAPIALFSISLFGSFSGRGDPEYQLSKTVLKESPTQRSLQEHKDQMTRTSSNLTWLIAGLLVWLFSYFL